MTQKELAMAVQKEFDNHSVKEIEALVKNIFLHIGQELVGGGKVQIAGFGTFEVKEREARKGMNPRTGEEIDLPATKRVAFKQSKVLKEALNEN